MEDYRYRFPSFGTADGMPTFTAAVLKDKLEYGTERFANYYVFRSEDDVIDRVSMETDVNDNVIAVNIYTSEELLAGMEDSFMECVQKNLAVVAWENYDDPNSCIVLDGIMEYVGMPYEDFLDSDFTRAVEAMSAAGSSRCL